MHMRMHTAASYALANQAMVKGAEVQLVASKPFLLCHIGLLALGSHLLIPLLELMQSRPEVLFPYHFVLALFFPFLYFVFFFYFLLSPP